MVCALPQTHAELSELSTARLSAAAAGHRLADAVALYGQIRESGLQPRDSSDAYQENWRLALSDVLSGRSTDYDYFGNAVGEEHDLSRCLRRPVCPIWAYNRAECIEVRRSNRQGHGRSEEQRPHLPLDRLCRRCFRRERQQFIAADYIGHLRVP